MGEFFDPYGIPTANTAAGTTTTTSFLPLTTAWSAPSICTTVFLGGDWWNINDPQYGLWVDPGVLCLPPAATTWWDQTWASNSLTTWSLGPVVCPQAYSTVMTSMQDTSTFIACCPSQYEFLGVSPRGSVGQCQSSVTPGQTVTVVTLLAGATVWVTITSVLTTTSHINGIPVNGWNFAALTTPSTTSTSTTAPSATSTSTTAPSATSTSTTAPSQTSASATSSSITPASQTNQSSTGTSDAVQPHSNSQRNFEIGIGVAVGAVAMAVVGFGMWYFLRKASRRQNRPHDSPPHLAINAFDRSPYKPRRSYVDKSLPVQEIHGSVGAHELEEPPWARELSSEERVYEMDGYRRWGE
ncbi:hypothetical protein OIDMADRAFT_34127 [Oidiodendron maius Zn]|uniref:Uncharacterized protein n=1 Tax=Oidiodendron maius (strain Zn) TaxID=913774 RepID=A0A0C3C8X4_OIDMZ|nr:hypothetical protein OIDMADRAFT_34127 [Oidiodendron maius Zn]